MTLSTTTRNALATVGFALILTFAAPIISFAQGRGNGKGAGPNFDKKCAKFVNCHDARDGRVDGRGPAVNPVINPTVNQIPQRPNIGIYRRDPNRDNQASYPRSRTRRVNRNNDPDGTRDDNWRRRRDNSDPAETRDRRTHRRNRTNVID